MCCLKYKRMTCEIQGDFSVWNSLFITVILLLGLVDKTCRQTVLPWRHVPGLLGENWLGNKPCNLKDVLSLFSKGREFDTLCFLFERVSNIFFWLTQSVIFHDQTSQPCTSSATYFCSFSSLLSGFETLVLLPPAFHCGAQEDTCRMSISALIGTQRSLGCLITQHTKVHTLLNKAHLQKVSSCCFSEYNSESLSSAILSLTPTGCGCVISFESTSKLSEFPI